MFPCVIFQCGGKGQWYGSKNQVARIVVYFGSIIWEESIIILMVIR
uniref:Uncharacterized protein n=1 Tax=Myoviridae sp. ctcyQ27 TaxID=2825139 RepID=A0A8S5UF90_9CAUD|nr:MAG TPA: hypothetical protein [Myoviridae sp. ctcyQ27]